MSQTLDEPNRVEEDQRPVRAAYNDLARQVTRIVASLDDLSERLDPILAREGAVPADERLVAVAEPTDVPLAQEFLAEIGRLVTIEARIRTLTSALGI